MIPPIERNSWKEIKRLDTSTKDDIENCLKEESFNSIFSTVLAFFIMLSIFKDGSSDGEILIGTVILSALLRWFFIGRKFKNLRTFPTAPGRENQLKQEWDEEHKKEEREALIFLNNLREKKNLD